MDQPQAVIDGLLAVPRPVAGVELQPVSLAHYLLLQKRGHRAVLADNPELSAFEWLELAFVLASPSREALRADAAGEDAWNEEVIAFGEAVPIAAWPALRAEVQRSLRVSFAAAPRESGGTKKKSSETPSTTSGSATPATAGLSPS